MPTQVIDFNTNLGALTVVLDGMPKGTELQDKIDEMYSNPQEYIYFSDINTKASEILKTIRTKAQTMDIVMSDDERILFFYYMPLKQLTNDWLSMYYERIETLAKQFMVADSTQHQHICCFTYEGMDLEGEEIGSAIELLQSMTNHEFQNTVYHDTYLLYASGITTLEDQENAMIQLLHLMSRKLYFSQLGFSAEDTSYLKVVNQSAYYEGQALSLDKKIKEIENWQKEQFDPDYVHMATVIKDAIEPMINRIEKEQNEFNDRIQLYPVNIRNYKRTFFGYECTLDDKEDHSVVKIKKAAFVEEKAEEMVRNYDPGAILEYAIQNMYYEDLKKLGALKNVKKEIWETDIKTLKDVVANQMGLAGKTPVVQQFVEKLYQKIETELEKCIDFAEKKYKHQDKERKSCMKVKKSAGKFDSLSTCCNKIVESTKYTIPTMFPLERGTKLIILVSGNLRNALTNQLESITNCSVAYAYQNIEPMEIVCLKVGSYINLTDIETSRNKLEQIL